jgi:hypothetical protein
MTKTIWTLWHQGYAAAPLLVKQCIDSWRRFNPDFEVRVLDATTLPQYTQLLADIDLQRPDITVQKVAALTRLALLRTYGGVWADATVHCAAPLHQWLPEYVDDVGFFAFRNPGRDRLISNWFIAAERDSMILAALFDLFVSLFRDNRFDNHGTPFGDEALRLLAQTLSVSAEATREWLSPVITKGLKVYPYFIFHYCFNKVVLDNPRCRELWQRTRGLDAGPPHRLQGLAMAGSEKACAHIRSKPSPMYKLDWRVDAGSEYWSAVLQELRTQTS